MSNLTTIWRIENEKGEGPYNKQSPLTEAFAQIAPEQAPLPHNDTKLHSSFGRVVTYYGYNFGFADLESYKAWFSDIAHRNMLAANNFKLVEYQLKKSDVVYGSKQVAFRRDNAEAINTLACNQLG